MVPVVEGQTVERQRETRPGNRVVVRFPHLGDIDALMVLERRKWTAEQAARPEDLLRRITEHPQCNAAAFDVGTGLALASLMTKPIAPEHIRTADTWEYCASAPTAVPGTTETLFGISLTSIDENACGAVRDFLMPRVVRAGFREAYLGSPLPGLRAWRRQNPDTPVSAYVHATWRGWPLDPQLRYYYQVWGCSWIEKVRPDYFPHPLSLDHGAVIGMDLTRYLEPGPIPNQFTRATHGVRSRSQEDAP